jgi:hypothetical protein
VATPDEFSLENLLADLPNAAPLPAPALSGTSASVETPPGSSLSGSAGEASGAPLTLNAAPSTFESLAAEGFVSPGRALGQAGDSSHDALPSEMVAPDALPFEDAASEAVAQDESSAAIAAYWKWMHERLTAHLEETEIDDLGAPPLYEYRSLGLFHTEGTEALAPSRAVGIRDRAAFEARTFEGLRDGFAMLG